MAITWTPMRTLFGKSVRSGVELELASQSGNASKVDWWLYGEGPVQEVYALSWRSDRGNGVRSITSGIGLPGQTRDVRVVASGQFTVNHADDGTGSASAWVANAAASGTVSAPVLGAEISGSRRTQTLTLPTINRIPGAPGMPEASIGLGELVVEAGVAAVNGAAPVLEYEQQMSVDGGDWVTIQTGARKATLATLGLGVLGKELEFRARARSVAGWGSWSPTRSLTAPRLLGVRHTEDGDIVCQYAERYLGAGVWTPCTVLERFDGAGWVAPT